MADRLDRLVRDVVRDLGADADVISDRDRRRLALHAGDLAQTLRRRRRGGIAAVVVVVTALAVGVPYALRNLATGQQPVQPGASDTLPPGVDPIPGVPTHVIDDTSAPIELVDGWYVLGNHLVLNPLTRRYDPFRAATVIPSLDGRWVATMSGGVFAYRVYDREQATSRLYTILTLVPPANSHVSELGWSPDGDTFVLAEWGNDNGMVVDGEWYEGPVLVVTRIHAPTRERTQNSIAFADFPCDPCQIVWLPSGDMGVLIQEPSGDPVGIQVLRPDGQRGDVLPIRGAPTGLGAWSPDGRYVVVGNQSLESSAGPWAPAQVVEVATGTVLQTLNGVDVVQAQWIDNQRLLTWEPIITGDGTVAEFRALVSLRTADGRLLERWIPPAEVVTVVPGPLGPLTIHLS